MFFVFKQKTAYEMRISDWSSDVCSSDLSPSFPCTRHTADRSAPRGPRLSAARVRKPASRKQPRLCGRRRAAAQRHHLFFDDLRHHLCSHLLQQALCAVMKARLVNTGVPYLAITAIFTTLLWLRSSSGEAGNTIELARLIAYNAATGDAWNTLWYIPVILILYAVSPLLFHIVSMPRWRWLMALRIVLPLAVSRTGTELTPAITIYFMGEYVFGLWLGRDLGARLKSERRAASWIAMVDGVSTAPLSLLHPADLDARGPGSSRESLCYIPKQKTVG